MFFHPTTLKNALPAIAVSAALLFAGTGVASAGANTAGPVQATPTSAHNVSPRGVYSAHAVTQAERAHAVSTNGAQADRSNTALGASSAADAGTQTASDYAQ